MDRGLSAVRRLGNVLKAIIAAVFCGFMAPAVLHAQLMDPTRPPDYMPGGAQQETGPLEAQGFNGSPWDLTSTLVSPQRTLAVINGQVVIKGSKIGDMTVEKIETDQVVLVGGGRTEVIDLVGHDIKKPVESGE